MSYPEVSAAEAGTNGREVFTLSAATSVWVNARSAQALRSVACSVLNDWGNRKFFDAL